MLKTVTGVFSYRKIDLGTRLLIENMSIPLEGSTVLDMGCGYGVIGIVLGYLSPKSEIYFVDVNKRAIWCTKENLKINLSHSLDRTHVFRGDYFDALKEENRIFDAIYTNPPLRKGKDEFLDLIDEVKEHLSPKGYFQFVIKRKMGASAILEHLKEHYPEENVMILNKKSGYWIFNAFYPST